MKFFTYAILGIALLWLAALFVASSEGCGRGREPRPGDLFDSIRPSRLVQIDLPADWGKKRYLVLTVVLARHRDGRVGRVPVNVDQPRKGMFDGVYTETVEQGRYVSAYSPFDVTTDEAIVQHLLVLQCESALPGWRVLEVPADSIRDSRDRVVHIPMPSFDQLIPVENHPDRAAIEPVMSR